MNTYHLKKISTCSLKEGVISSPSRKLLKILRYSMTRTALAIVFFGFKEGCRFAFFLVATLVTVPLGAEAVLTRISGPKEPVNEVAEVAGEVLVGMESGLYRIEGDELIPIMTGFSIRAIEAGSGRVWFGSGCKGLFYIDKDISIKNMKEEQIERSEIIGPEACVNTLRRVGDDSIWVGTRVSLHRIGIDVESIEGLGWIHSIEHIDEETWVGSNQNAFRYDKLGSRIGEGVFSSRTGVVSIVGVGGDIWFITEVAMAQVADYGPCYQFDPVNNRVIPFFEKQGGCVSISGRPGELWYATKHGVYKRMAGKTNMIVTLKDERVNTIFFVGQDVYIGTTKALYRVSGLDGQEIPHKLQTDIEVLDIWFADSQIWVLTYQGLYRIDRGSQFGPLIIGVIILVAISLFIGSWIVWRSISASASTGSGPPTSNSTADTVLPDTVMIDDSAKIIASRYEVIRTIGRGGMGEVMLANDLHLDRRVALKRLYQKVEQKSRIRFEKEAKILANINHANVVTVYDWLQDDDSFIVMEYIEGESLGQLLMNDIDYCRRGLKTIFLQICAGLSAAHVEGVVHRDITPKNIMVITREDGPSVRIVDFGIAKLLGDPLLTTIPMGTPPFMAPERIMGRASDARADIYSVGKLLYLVAAGEIPLYENLDEYLVEDAQPPSVKNSEISQKLEKLIMACIAKDIDERPATIEYVAAVLRNIKSLFSVST